MTETLSFWKSIEKSLRTIADDKPDTFDGVKAILDKYGNPEPVYPRNFTADQAFFAGSGGDETLGAALRLAGWRTVWSEASYYYVMLHPATGELLSYIEGDVERGVNGDEPGNALRAQVAADEDLVSTESESGRLLTVRTRPTA